MLALSSWTTCLLPSAPAWHVQPMDSRHMMPRMLVKKKRAGGGRPALDYVRLEEDGSDTWRASGALDVIRSGGCGVIPTDTSYSFVTTVSSKEGVERILRLKGAANQKKPLSLLCRDLATIDEFALGIDKPIYKLLRSHLPGPYTFILRASPALPKVVYHDGQRQWKRSEIGVRIPADAICTFLLEQLDEPLLCSTVPTDEESGAQLVCDLQLGETWCTSVDFVLDAGPRPLDGSTVYDLREEEPALVREGIGPPLAELV